MHVYYMQCMLLDSKVTVDEQVFIYYMDQKSDQGQLWIDKYCMRAPVHYTVA